MACREGRPPAVASSQPYLCRAQGIGTMGAWSWGLPAAFFLAYFKIGFRFLSTSDTLWKK